MFGIRLSTAVSSESWRWLTDTVQPLVIGGANFFTLTILGRLGPRGGGGGGRKRGEGQIHPKDADTSIRVDLIV